MWSKVLDASAMMNFLLNFRREVWRGGDFRLLRRFATPLSLMASS